MPTIFCTVDDKSPDPSLTTPKEEIRGKLFYYVIAYSTI
jgi:hypothetical protein